MNKLDKKLGIAAVLGVGMLVAGVASATTVTMDFEGLAGTPAEYIDNFYNGGCGTLVVGGKLGKPTCGGPDYGVVWSNALVGPKPNGHEPSPPNIMKYQGSSATMNVAAGFTDLLEFYFSAPNASGGIAIYSGLDGKGTLLASGNLGSTPVNCGGSGPIIGRGDCWDAFSLNFSGIAQSVVFATKAGTIGFDDVRITLYTPAANVREPAALGTFGLGALLVGLFVGLRRRFG